MKMVSQTTLKVLEHPSLASVTGVGTSIKVVICGDRNTYARRLALAQYRNM